MRFMLLVHVDPRKFEGITEAEQKALDVQNLAEDKALIESGQLIAAGPLADPETATIIRSSDGEISMTDGPYIETKEHVAGFMFIKARDREEAIEIASKSPVARIGTIEVRAASYIEPK